MAGPPSSRTRPQRDNARRTVGRHDACPRPTRTTRGPRRRRPGQQGVHHGRPGGRQRRQTGQFARDAALRRAASCGTYDQYSPVVVADKLVFSSRDGATASGTPFAREGALGGECSNHAKTGPMHGNRVCSGYARSKPCHLLAIQPMRNWFRRLPMRLEHFVIVASSVRTTCRPATSPRAS